MNNENWTQWISEKNTQQKSDQNKLFLSKKLEITIFCDKSKTVLNM